MTILEAVKQSKTPSIMHKDAIQIAQEALTDPELVLWAHTGNVKLDETLGGAENGLKPGVTVITSHRILFVFCVLGRSFVKQILLPNIQTTELKKGLASWSLLVSSTDGELVVEGNPKTTPELKTALDAAISNSGDLPSSELTALRNSPTPTAQLPIAQESPVSAATKADSEHNESPESTAEPDTPVETTVDLEPYFQTHYPSRMSAVKALHRDTAMDLKQCKILIDNYFAANLARAPMRNVDTAKELKRYFNPKKAALDERKEALDQQGIAYCPKCASVSIAARKRGFSVGRGLAGSLINPGVGLIAGAIGSNKPELVCMKCGHVWKP